MYNDPKNYLLHIKDECDYILTVVHKYHAKQVFLGDETAKRAVVRSLEIIGEASKKIPLDFKNKWK